MQPAGTPTSLRRRVGAAGGAVSLPRVIFPPKELTTAGGRAPRSGGHSRSGSGLRGPLSHPAGVRGGAAALDWWGPRPASSPGRAGTDEDPGLFIGSRVTPSGPSASASRQRGAAGQPACPGPPGLCLGWRAPCCHPPAVLECQAGRVDWSSWVGLVRSTAQQDLEVGFGDSI